MRPKALTALVTRYKNHPGMGGYDVWNECNTRPPTVTARRRRKFRGWLRARYGGDARAGAGLAAPQPPGVGRCAAAARHGPYPDTLDWLQFRIDNAYAALRWRVDLIRGLDPEHPVTAHGIAASLTGMASGGADDWRAAAEVDSYGYTWGAARRGNEPWKQWHAVDLVRAACRGKRFWHAEAYAGPLWMQPNVIGRPRDDGRIADPEHIRLWDMTSFAAGATGLMYLRWRPLLNGPLFGAFGAYGMDGSRTPRSAMASDIARWVAAPEQQPLWEARPVRGEIGIVYAPETELFCYAQQGNTEYYAQSLRGAYQGFFESNIQADWVHIDDIARYDLLYLAFPYMLSQASAAALASWVEGGGTLIAEGCPAYFGDRGRVGTRQPNYGMDAVFGVRESYVEFTPDLSDGFDMGIDGLNVPGGLFLQAYDLAGGTARGWYTDGRIAVVDHSYGNGKTRLIGTFPGYGYWKRPGTDARQFFAGLLPWAGKQPHLRIKGEDGATSAVARLHAGETGAFLWVVNHDHAPQTVEVEVGEGWGPFDGADLRWGAHPPQVGGRRVRVAVEGRDAAVMRLH